MASQDKKIREVYAVCVLAHFSITAADINADRLKPSLLRHSFIIAISCANAPVVLKVVIPVLAINNLKFIN